MKGFRRQLSEWLGHDRRERRASLLLFLAIIVMVAVRHLVPAGSDLPELRVLTDAPSALLSAPATVAADSRESPATPPQNRQKPLYIELNSADSLALQALPGIGPVLSSRIVRYRNLLGGFADKSQLLEVYGLKEEVFNRISEQVWTDTMLIRKLEVNRDDFRTLLRHPYLEYEKVASLLRYRERVGHIASAEVLEAGGILTGCHKLLGHYFSYR